LNDIIDVPTIDGEKSSDFLKALIEV